MTNEIDEERIDGRSLRSARTRRVVAEAFLDLLDDGVPQPTAQQVSELSGVSPSTIFRLFDDLDGMYAEAFSVQVERVEHLLEAIPDHGPLHLRLRKLVRVRARVYEQAAPVLRFQTRSTAQTAGRWANRSVGNTILRNEVAQVFASELAQARPDALDSVDALTSWEFWDRLRFTQGLSVAKAKSAVEATVLGVLGPDSK
jgi:AcrR family transcriptional regulator